VEEEAHPSAIITFDYPARTGDDIDGITPTMGPQQMQQTQAPSSSSSQGPANSAEMMMTPLEKPGRKPSSTLTI